MKELMIRLKADMPSFFVKLQKIALSCSIVGTAVVAASTQMPDLHIPGIISTVANYMIWCGLVAAGVAQTTKK